MMNHTIPATQAINDHCRFLLMEMGIGILYSQMQKIIDNIMSNFPNLPKTKEDVINATYENILLKAIIEVYDSHSTYYSKRSGLFNLKTNRGTNRAEQLLFLQQLSNRMHLKDLPTPLPNHFSLREALQYLPALDAKFQCYGVQPKETNNCIPVHPWLWRKHLKQNYYANSLPCLHHKKSWYASSDHFYLQDHQGHFLSHHQELSSKKSKYVNELLMSLDVPYQCFLLTTEDSYKIPISKTQSLPISFISSPLNFIDDRFTLIPFKILTHPLIQSQLYMSASKVSSIVDKPLIQLKKRHNIQLEFYDFNPFLIFNGTKLSGIIYRQVAWLRAYPLK